VKGLIEVLVHALVEHPDAVTVAEHEDEPGEHTYSVRVHPSDAGRAIGRGGRVAGAIRTVARYAAERQGRRVRVEIDT
jgi:predicted RNA-binding protein YlqC (UPF0109 family)